MIFVTIICIIIIVIMYHFYYVSFQTLDLSHMYLEDITGMFPAGSELRVLDLSHNQITFVPPRTFNHLVQLRVLKLDHNQFLDIMDLTGLTQLHELDMSFNMLTDLDTTVS